MMVPAFPSDTLVQILQNSPVDVVPRRAIREELREAILADAIDIR